MKSKPKLVCYILFFVFLSCPLISFAENADLQDTIASSASTFPQIILQPVDVSALIGDTVVFSVDAIGTNLQYQWQTSKDNGETWVDSRLAGNNECTLSVEAIQQREGYRFRCRITSGNNSILSDYATLNVIDKKLTILKQPDNVSSAVGRTVTFRVQSSEKEIHYQWQTSVDGGLSWTDSRLPGNNTDMLLVNVIESRNHYRFRCAVSQKDCVVISDTAELTVQEDIPNYCMDLQINSYDKTNTIWSYPLSMNPIILSYNGIYNKVYWGYTTEEGYSGIASYDLDSGAIEKTHLKQSETDDHNNTSIFIQNGRLIVSYPTGHNTGCTMNYRVSTGPESISEFLPTYQYCSDGCTCYGQFFECGGILYSFFRHNNQNWHSLASYDSGETWGDEKRILNSSMQYYCKFQKTTVDGLLRMCMYSNPAGTDPSIRMGFLDLNSGTIYNSDNATILGNWENGVSYLDFDQIIVPEHTQRLFDVAISDPNDISILICSFSMNSNDDAEYLWFKNGSIIKICDAGESFWYPKYQNGVSFLGTDRAILGRSDKTNVPNGRDYIEVWNLESVPTLNKRIYSEEKGPANIRNIRPIVDQDGKVIIWQRGYYDHYSYNNFHTDTMIYLVEEDRVV